MGINSIKEKDFFRLSFILQDSSETTNNASLRKIIEEVLFNNRSEMEIDEIREVIFKNFELEFTNDEIRSALNLSKNKHIIETEGKYILSANYISELAKGMTVEEKLKGLIKEFKNNLNIEKEENELYLLLSRYIFHCFNSGKQDIFALVNGIKTNEDIEFSASEEEKHIINDFLNWDNDNKNKFIYNVISYSYVYCSLTTKKNSLLSKTIFSNKEFYLDANIIFRLAGLNKEDRQKTISSFKNKCEELNIKLFYTTDTYDEIVSAVNKSIKWLNYTNSDSFPPNLKIIPDDKKDIYNIYCSWCSNRNNKPGDYKTFNRYIISMINNSLNNIKSVDINRINEKEVSEMTDDILSYKQSKNRETSDESARIDAKNILNVVDRRSKSDNKSMFSVQQYLISADQVLASFINKNKPGIPIVVKPSTWLSIMLKFGGRTENDIKSFILFLNLRYENKERNSIDITSLLHELSIRTDSSEIKELIVEDIYINKDKEYKELIENDDYERITLKSFDKVVKEKNSIKEQEFRIEKEEIEKRNKAEKENAERIAKELSNEENARKLAEEEYKRKNHYKVFALYFVMGAVIVLFLYIVYSIASVFRIELPIKLFLPQFIYDNRYITVSIFILGGLGKVVLFLVKRVKYVKSSEYKEKYVNKEKNKFLKVFLN